MSNASSRGALVERLASLLGFEDGASDVLDHLLTIESETDLMDYMSQLLGQEDDSVREFVKDVCRFHNGEEILPAQKEDDDDTKPKATVSAASAKESASKPEEIAKQKTLEGRRQGGNRSRTPPKKAANKPLPTKATGAATSNNSSKTIATMGATKSTGASAESTNSKSELFKNDKRGSVSKEQAPPPKKAPPPPRGKATIVCGCFGTKHKCLTNCLYCGRISCEREGYSYCPFCGFLVQEFKGKNPPATAETSGSNMDEAWEHKERLLRFDRDFARRTVILDDQADYFASKTSSWMTDKEKEDAQDADHQQRQEMHERKKQQLNIAF